MTNPHPKPNLIDSFTYLDEKIGVEWYDIARGDEMPSLPWSQVYAVANASGKVGLVYDSSEQPNLPGGKPEPGETIDQTIRRELIEEMNYEVKDWWPIGYQRLTYPSGKIKYQLRLYAVIEKIGDFSQDNGGGVIGQKFVNFEDLNDTIQYGKVGERIMKMIEKEFRSVTE